MSRKYAQKHRFVCVFIIEPWNEDIFMGGFLTLGGNTLKRGGGNVNKVGQRFPIICLHLEPVIIFAVPMILNFLVEQT